MPDLLRMPEIAASTTEAVLSRWPLAENAAFSARDVIVTVETDKAVVDVEAEADGVLLRTLVPEGAEVSVGSAIALIGKPGEDVGDLDAALAELGVTAEQGTQSAPPQPSAEPTAAPETASAPEAAPAVREAPVPPTPAADRPAGERRFASPLARRLAADAGLVVEDLVGSGPGGRIVRRDVERAVTERVAPEEASGTSADEPDVAPVMTSQPQEAVSASAGGYTDEPVSRMRKAIAARLTESKATAPHFYVRGTARVDELLRLRGELNDGRVRISVNDLVVKAVAQAHTLVPAMNVIWTGDAVRSFHRADVAVAVATEKGLVTPVLRSVDQMSITAVAVATRDLLERAKLGRLQQQELEGGTISVSNLGMYGTEEFAAILNPPQSAVLAVGAARPEPVVTDGRVEAGTVVRVTLSVDHRPVDGATAAEWMKAFLGLLEAPLRILA